MKFLVLVSDSSFVIYLSDAKERSITGYNTTLLSILMEQFNSPLLTNCIQSAINDASLQSNVTIVSLLGVK